jgi:small conductance mechanosensitive channel
MVSVIIWGTAILISLTVVGVNIAPLLASAGIAGVALGFGAQTLVKDYISGIFLIIEDQYGIGDEVEIGTVRGRVEAVALRTTRVRDEAGVLWYIRNGEILNVANFSQNTTWEK